MKVSVVEILAFLLGDCLRFLIVIIIKKFVIIIKKLIICKILKLSIPDNTPKPKDI